MDAMVTARMSPGKKEAGNSALRELGTNPSQFINEIYDYVIRNKRLPLTDGSAYSGKRDIREALAFIDSIPLQSPNRFAFMTDDEIRQERLIARGLVPEGYFE